MIKGWSPSAAYKILADEKRRILGAHILSDNATGLINSLTLAMVNGMDIDTLYRRASSHPIRPESDLVYMLKPLLTDANQG